MNKNAIHEYPIKIENVISISEYLLALPATSFKPVIRKDIDILLTSLATGLKAYSTTKVCYSSHNSEINIIDHYLQALINIDAAIYQVLTDDAKIILINKLSD